MREFELTMRLRNNLLKRRRLELGLSTHEAAEKIGIGYATYLEIEGLRRSPIGGAGGGHDRTGWRPSALKIAAFYGCSPEELFPGVVIAVTTPELAVEMSGEAVLAIAAHCAERASPMLPDAAIEEAEDAAELDRALLQLTAREEYVLGHRFGLDSDEERSLTEVGEGMGGLSKERVRQIESDALRKIRATVDASRAKEATREAMAMPGRKS